MATASKAKTSFKVTCPCCGDRDATLRIDLNDLNVIVCTSCEDEFSPHAARAKAAAELARWEAICRWVSMADEAMAEASAE